VRTKVGWSIRTAIRRARNDDLENAYRGSGKTTNAEDRNSGRAGPSGCMPPGIGPGPYSPTPSVALGRNSRAGTSPRMRASGYENMTEVDLAQIGGCTRRRRFRPLTAGHAWCAARPGNKQATCAVSFLTPQGRQAGIENASGSVSMNVFALIRPEVEMSGGLYHRPSAAAREGIEITIKRQAGPGARQGFEIWCRAAEMKPSVPSGLLGTGPLGRVGLWPLMAAAVDQHRCCPPAHRR